MYQHPQMYVSVVSWKRHISKTECSKFNEYCNQFLKMGHFLPFIEMCCVWACLNTTSNESILRYKNWTLIQTSIYMPEISICFQFSIFHINVREPSCEHKTMQHYNEWPLLQWHLVANWDEFDVHRFRHVAIRLHKLLELRQTCCSFQVED